MARTGENIYKRKDGRWEARFICSHDENGKSRYRSVYGKTHAEAKHKLLKAITEAAQLKETANASDIAFEKLTADWLDYIRHNVKESTYVCYVLTLDRHILPYWSGHSIGQITTQAMSEYISGLLKNGKSDGSGLARKTVENIFVLLKGIFKYAGKRYEVVCDFTQITIPKSRRNIRVLTQHEQRCLEKVLLTDTDRSKLGVLLCLYTGIRLGEVCALKGEHFELIERVLRVRSTMQRIKNLSGEGETKTKIIITAPKSKNSERDIPLPKSLLPLLRKWATEPDSYILTGSPDIFVEPRTMQNHFKSYIKCAGIKDTNFHTTRHTFATNAVEQGFDVKSLSEILGHANVNTTLELYVHPSFEMKRKYMDKLTPAFI